MLPVGVELNSAVVASVAGIFNTCLECACKTEIDGEIQKSELVGAAYIGSRISGAIVHDDVIIRRVVANEFPHDSFKIIGFVIGRYYQNRSHDAILPRSSAEREWGRILGDVGHVCHSDNRWRRIPVFARISFS